MTRTELIARLRQGDATGGMLWDAAYMLKSDAAEIDKLKEAARLALSALEHVQWKNWRTDKAIAALNEALK